MSPLRGLKGGWIVFVLPRCRPYGAYEQENGFLYVNSIICLTNNFRQKYPNFLGKTLFKAILTHFYGISYLSFTIARGGVNVSKTG